MRVVLVNWARIWDGAPVGGGVNGYCQSLALEFVQAGHEVAYLSSGTYFTPDPLATEIRPGPCTVRRHPDWLGIKVFEVVNSPVLAPSAYQFGGPAAEITDPCLEERVAELLVRLSPDVVHFHNIEGLTAGTVAAVRAALPAAPIIYSLHNYHTICPQVYLMRHNLYPCHDDHGTRDCQSCVESPSPENERLRRAREWATAVGFTPLVVRPAPPPAISTPETETRSLRHAFSGIFHRSGNGAHPHPQAIPAVRAAPDLPLPGYPAESQAAVEPAFPYPGPADPRGQTAAILAEMVSQPPSPGAREWEPVTNAIRPQTADPAETNAYARRRRAMVAMLNSCDRVLAVSTFVRAKFESFGVDPARIQTMPIGTRAARIAARSSSALFDPPPFHATDTRPIRIIFIGHNSVYKGLPMLADTLDLLTPETLSRFHLHLCAQSIETIEGRFRRLEPSLGGLTIGYGYQPHDIPRLCAGKDVGLVTSVWWDNAPQTVFEFFSCGLPVLAADIGGIPDFVRDGSNGLLFRANDRFDLARRLAMIARTPSILTDLRKNVRPPKDITDHARELHDLYTRCLADRRPQENPARTTPPLVADRSGP